MLENRQQTGFNATVPGHGLMIYHKDNRPYMRSETGNNKTHPLSFYPKCANSTVALPTSDPASYGVVDAASCPFPGTLGKRSFRDADTPSAQSWAGVNTGLPITNITENADHTVSFNFLSCINVTSLVDFGKLPPNTTSTEQSFTVSGSNLPSDIVITPPVGFEVSLTSGTGFVGNPASLTLAHSGGTVAATTVYVRFHPTAYQSYSSNINLVSGAITQIAPVIGQGNGVYWTGTTSTEWNLASNWGGGSVPTSVSDVIIPASGITNWPLISTANAACQDITLQSGAQLTMSGTAAYSLSVSGNWTNNGSFTAGVGTVDFCGTNDLQTISGTSTSTFNVLKVDKGAQSRILEATSLITLSGTTNPLVITSGTFKLSSASTITPFTTFAGATINSNSGLWNNGGFFNTTNTHWLINGGLLRLTNGTITISGSYSLQYINNGSLQVEGGEIYIGRGISNNHATSPGIFNISGGTVTVRTSTSTSEIGFAINPASSLTWSGGTLIIQRAASSAALEASILPETSNIIGGTLQIGNASTIAGQIIRINSSVPIYNLVVNSTNAPTAQLAVNPLTIKGDVTIGTGAKIDANSLNLSVGGNWTNGGTFTPGTGTVTCNGTANQTLISGGSGTGKAFYNLAVNNPAGVTLSTNDLSVSNLLTFTSGVVTTGNSKLIIPATGSVSRTSGHVNGNLQKNVATGTAVSHTFEVGDAVETNYAPVTVSFASVATAGNLVATTVSGDYSLVANSTLNAAKSVNRYWTLVNNGVGFTTYDGTFNFAASDLDASTTSSNLIAGKFIPSTWTYPTVGTKSATSTQLTGLTSFGDFQLAEGFGKIGMGGNWSSPSTWSDNVVPVVTDNVQIASSGTVNVDVANAACNDLSIQSGATLNIAPAKALTVNGTFTNNAGNNGFILQSDATGAATFLDNGTANTAVAATVQQYLPSVRNWYMSSPVTGAIAPAGNTYYKYVETANDGATWTPVSSGATFDVMTGYTVKPSGATTFAFSGVLNTGAQSISSLTSTATAKTGYNLVGNPYPSYVNWMSATKTNLSTTIWYRTQNSATTPAYVFDTYNETANTGTNNNGVAAVTGMIPPMQAFWVKINTGATGTLAFDNSIRSHQDVSTNQFRAPAANATQQTLRLQVSNGTNIDEAIVLFNANAADGYDAYDSPKMTNANASIPEIYTFAGTEKAVINGLNSIATNSLVSLGFSTGVANTFSIKATEVTNFDTDTRIVLKDKVLNVEQDITDGTPYNFTSDVTSTDNRFSVVFKSKSSITGIDNSVEKETIIVSKNANNQIVVTNNANTQTGVVVVSNAIGQRLYSAAITGVTTVVTKSFSPGVYLVTVNEGEKHVPKKVIIN